VLVAAAVCPHPPLLVPRVAGTIAPDLDACRAACAAAIEGLAQAEPDVLVVVGGGRVTREHSPDSVGTLGPYGVEVRLGAGDGDATLPLSLGIGRWLIDTVTTAPSVPRAFVEVATDELPEAAAKVGASIAERAPRVALLTMADGSAFTSQTPVGDDGRGERYDARIVEALIAGDVDALLAIAPADDGPLWVSGRAALQTLAGAIEQSGCRWTGDVRWRGSPYGVGYVVAELRPQPTS
jgi:hypothetical protein